MNRVLSSELDPLEPRPRVFKERSVAIQEMNVPTKTNRIRRIDRVTPLCLLGVLGEKLLVFAGDRMERSSFVSHEIPNLCEKETLSLTGLCADVLKSNLTMSTAESPEAHSPPISEYNEIECLSHAVGSTSMAR